MKKISPKKEAAALLSPPFHDSNSTSTLHSLAPNMQEEDQQMKNTNLFSSRRHQD